MPSRYDVTRAELEEILHGEAPYRVAQVWDGLHVRTRTPTEMTDLPMALRTRVDDSLPSGLAERACSKSDDGATVKWLWELEGGALVETVLMHYGRRSTVCVSSQAGCAMRCQFCATGQSGFDRHLTVGEIVEQVVMAVRRADPKRVSNVVFMGMGEPLANYDNVMGAVRRLHEHMGFSARHLTLSTVGIIPGIKRLAEEKLPVNLAVSLHAANDELRDELVPINRRYPLAELAQVCARYVAATRRRLSLEWALIDGVNDRPTDATELAEFARPLRAHVNLIPLNPTPGYGMPGSTPAGVLRFQAQLGRAGVNTTVRSTRGVEIDAACGQLAARTR